MFLHTVLLSEAAALGDVSPGLCLSASESIFRLYCLLDIPTELNRLNRHFGISVLWAKARGAVFLNNFVQNVPETYMLETEFLSLGPERQH